MNGVGSWFMSDSKSAKFKVWLFGKYILHMCILLANNTVTAIASKFVFNGISMAFNFLDTAMSTPHLRGYRNPYFCWM